MANVVDAGCSRYEYSTLLRLHTPLHTHHHVHIHVHVLIHTHGCNTIRCVQRMDHDCALVPRGALVVDASKRIIESAHFDGLSFLSAGDKRSYMHCRPPESLQGTYVRYTCTLLSRIICVIVWVTKYLHPVLFLPLMRLQIDTFTPVCEGEVRNNFYLFHT